MADKKVLYNKKISEGFFRLGFDSSGFECVQGGEFVMLGLKGESFDPLLKRAFGVYKSENNKIEIVYKVVGKATSLMTHVCAGDTIDIEGPFGKHFSQPRDGKKVILIAGGVGIAPFYLMAKEIKKDAILIYGGRTKEDLIIAEDFKNLGCQVKLVTEDGSIGEKGLVTDVLATMKNDMTDCVLYSCGPTPMLKAVSMIALKENIVSYVSLEGRMACGFGVCLGCAVKTTTEGNKMVCKDGTIFASKEIDWKSA